MEEIISPIRPNDEKGSLFMVFMDSFTRHLKFHCILVSFSSIGGLIICEMCMMRTMLMQRKSTDSSLDHTRCLNCFLRLKWISIHDDFRFCHYSISYFNAKVTKLWQWRSSKNTYFLPEKRNILDKNRTHNSVGNHQHPGIMIFYYVKTIHKWIKIFWQRHSSRFHAYAISVQWKVENPNLMVINDVQV